MNTQWTLGVLIALPFTLLLIIVLIVLAFWMRGRVEDADHIDRDDWRFGSFASGLSAVIIGIVTIAVMFPWLPEYHQWKPITGVVQKNDSRLIADGKAMSQRFVLVIDGQPYGVDDTRAATVKPGDTVSLKCRKDWQYASVPGWVCRWNQ